MIRALHRRLHRLTHQIAIGRLVTLSIAHEHVDDSALIDSTLSAAGLEREQHDLLLLLKRYGRLAAEPPCELISVSPLPSGGRRQHR
jgi:hypothetical protein